MNSLEILNNLDSFLSYSVFSVPLKEILLSFAILFLFLVFKNIILKIIVSSAKKAAKKTKTTIDESIVDLLEPPLRFLITSTGVFLALNVFTFEKEISFLIINLYKSALILSFFWLLYRAEVVFQGYFERYAHHKQIEIAVDFLPLFRKFIKAAIVVLAATIIIQEWGYNIGAIITGLGIGGLAVALAAKDTLANFFGSLMIIMDRPFAIGDWVKSAETEGIVEEIGFRTTRVRTFEKALVSIPNSKIATDNVINNSRRDRRRIMCSVGATYSTPVDTLIKSVDKIRNMLFDHDKIHNDMIMVYFNEFAASSLNIFIYCFTTTSDWDEYLSIRQDVHFKIMHIFEELDISFAFPSMSVYHENLGDKSIMDNEKS